MDYSEDANNHQQSPTDSRLMEIGMLVAGKFDCPDQHAIKGVRKKLQQRMSDEFPRFNWELPLVVRGEMTSALSLDPISLLDSALGEEGNRGWDFTFVLTPAELIGVCRKSPQAAVSRPWRRPS